MTCPVQHSLITGAYKPLLLNTFDRNKLNITFEDNYPEFFEILGITRDEMLVLFPAIMTVDMLSKNDILEYYE